MLKCKSFCFPVNEIGYFYQLHFLKNLLIYYFWLCWVFVAARGKWGLLFIAVCGLLIAVAPLVVEHGLSVRGLQ